MNTPGLLGEAGPRLVDEAPALASASWLPRSSGVSELDDLAVTHRRLLARRAQLGEEARALHERLDAEDAAHEVALVAGVLADEPADLAAVTPPEERAEAFRALSERALATNAALDQFLRDAVATIEQHAPTWLGELAARCEDAAVKRREAERLLAEAEAVEAGTWRIGEWIERNAGIHRNRGFNAIPGFRHIGWDTVQTFTPPPAVEQDGRPQLVDPPSIVPWDAEQQAQRVAFGRQSRAKEQEEFPERFLPDELSNLHR